MTGRIGTLNTFASLTTDAVLAIDFNTNAISAAFNDSSLGWSNGIATDTGSANNYIVASVFGTASNYNSGMLIAFLPANTNTGASTITVDTRPAVSILDYAGNQVLPGAIRSGVLTVVWYIAGAFRLLYTSVPQLQFFSAVPLAAGTISCNFLGAAWATILVDATNAPSGSAFTIAITNVAVGCHIMVNIIPKGASQVFKWTGTDTGGNTITPIRSFYSNTATSNATKNDLINTGDTTSVGTKLIYVGAYMRQAGGFTGLDFEASFG